MTKKSSLPMLKNRVLIKRSGSMSVFPSLDIYSDPDIIVSPLNTQFSESLCSLEYFDVGKKDLNAMDIDAMSIEK